MGHGLTADSGRSAAGVESSQQVASQPSMPAGGTAAQALEGNQSSGGAGGDSGGSSAGASYLPRTCWVIFLDRDITDTAPKCVLTEALEDWKI